jgi:hypothetical protein
VGERHTHLLAPLAFLSPRIIAAIVDGTTPADLTVTGLANTTPCTDFIAVFQCLH